MTSSLTGDKKKLSSPNCSYTLVLNTLTSSSFVCLNIMQIKDATIFFNCMLDYVVNEVIDNWYELIDSTNCFISYFQNSWDGGFFP